MRIPAKYLHDYFPLSRTLVSENSKEVIVNRLEGESSQRQMASKLLITLSTTDRVIIQFTNDGKKKTTSYSVRPLMWLRATRRKSEEKNILDIM